ncbi:unnamed protein product [Blepharisma stoltei]|uniref:NADP-dependent oxidoreductase domain-containing protein n=1 Tax=Blepharisma stoltei TaxID=1481888 RepID=A0AAU9K7R0_9CILI|nr:unnamed protein product [Blepharisma stoltei]
MAILNKAIKLASGVQIPQIGIGTFDMRGTDCTSAVSSALKLGYRHIDTALAYKNENVLKLAVNRVPRENVFISTKIIPSSKGFQFTYIKVLKSLEAMHCKYFDMVLLHWPGVDGFRPDDPRMPKMRLHSWEALEVLKEEGKVKSIGVSNFLINHLEQLLERAKTKPDVNQIEHHPYCQNGGLIDFCRENSIQIVASSPLAKGNESLFNNETLKSIAEDKKATVAQVALKWAAQKDFVIIPKSVNLSRMKENINLDFFSLNAEDLARIDSLNQNFHVSWDPSTILT